MNIETELALDLAREKAKNGEIIPVIKYMERAKFIGLQIAKNGGEK